MHKFDIMRDYVAKSELHIFFMFNVYE